MFNLSCLEATPPKRADFRKECKVMNIFENMSTFVIQNQIIIEYDAESQHKINEIKDSSAVLGRSDPRGVSCRRQSRCRSVDSRADLPDNRLPANPLQSVQRTRRHTQRHRLGRQTGASVRPRQRRYDHQRHQKAHRNIHRPLHRLRSGDDPGHLREHIQD